MREKTWVDGLLDFFLDSSTAVKVLASIIAIIGGLLVGLVIMLVLDPSRAFAGFSTILFGLFRNGTQSIGNMLYYAVPIILTGLSVAFAFRTGLFNIGATGQLTFGAFFAVYVGINWTFLGSFHWVVALLAGGLAGAFWGMIPGMLKAFRNVNEVVASIMLNYVAMYFSTLMVKTLIYNRSVARAFGPAESALIPKGFFDTLTNGSSLNYGLFVAFLVTAILHIILSKTTFGFQLKSVGFNRDASRYAGMNEKRNIILAMTIAGFVSGLAGAIMFLVPGRFLTIESNLLQEGFTGIAVSLLGLSSPIGVLIAGIFYGSLEIGGFYLQVTTSFVPELIEIIIAAIIYISALALFFQNAIYKTLKKRKDARLGEVPNE